VAADFFALLVLVLFAVVVIFFVDDLVVDLDELICLTELVCLMELEDVLLADVCSVVVGMTLTEVASWGLSFIFDMTDEADCDELTVVVAGFAFFKPG